MWLMIEFRRRVMIILPKFQFEMEFEVIWTQNGDV